MIFGYKHEIIYALVRVSRNLRHGSCLTNQLPTVRKRLKKELVRETRTKA
jgi:hypothetical protein